jgi:hypothetical protein
MTSAAEEEGREISKMVRANVRRRIRKKNIFTTIWDWEALLVKSDSSFTADALMQFVGLTQTIGESSR